MSLLFKKTPPQRSAVEQRRHLECESWHALHKNVGNATTARLIVELLDQHPELKQANAGLYILARDTVQRSRIRYAKGFRKGAQMAGFIKVLHQCALFLTRGLVNHVPSFNTTHHTSGHTDRSSQSQNKLVWPVLYETPASNR